MNKIYVVTNVELSCLDAVVAVFNSDEVSYKELEEKFDGNLGYVIHGAFNFSRIEDFNE